MSRVLGLSVVIAAGASAAALPAAAAVTYTSQVRTVSATTDADGVTVSRSAPDFSRFTDNASRLVPITTNTGTGTNAADSGIDCILDPNAITAVGTLSGSGGLAVINGTPTLVAGEAAAVIRIAFTITDPTPFRLTATARPTDDPGDRYKLKLDDLTRAATLVDVDQNDPIAPVDALGVLQPGNYMFEYELEAHFDADTALRTYALNFAIPAPSTAAALLFALAPLGRRRR